MNKVKQILLALFGIGFTAIIAGCGTPNATTTIHRDYANYQSMSLDEALRQIGKLDLDQFRDLSDKRFDVAPKTTSLNQEGFDCELLITVTDSSHTIQTSHYVQSIHAYHHEKLRQHLSFSEIYKIQMYYPNKSYRPAVTNCGIALWDKQGQALFRVIHKEDLDKYASAFLTLCQNVR